MDELELKVPLDFNELLVELNDIGRPKTIHHKKIQLIDFEPYEKKEHRAISTPIIETKN